MRARCVPGGVGQRLLHHAVRGAVHRGRDRERCSAAHQLHVHARGAGPVDQCLHRFVRRLQGALRALAQQPDRLPQPVGGRYGGGAQRGRGPPVLFGHVGGQLQRPGAQRDERQRVAERVVHVRGDPGALAQPGALGDELLLPLQLRHALPAGLHQLGLLAAEPSGQPRQADEHRQQPQQADRASRVDGEVDHARHGGQREHDPAVPHREVAAVQVPRHGQHHEQRLPPQRDRVLVDRVGQARADDDEQDRGVPHRATPRARSRPARRRFTTRNSAVLTPARAATSSVMVSGSGK